LLAVRVEGREPDRGNENQFPNRCREGDRHILLRDHRGDGARRNMSQSPAVLKLLLEVEGSWRTFAARASS